MLFDKKNFSISFADFEAPRGKSDVLIENEFKSEGQI